MKRLLCLITLSSFFSCYPAAAPTKCKKPYSFSATYKNPSKTPIVIKVYGSNGLISESSPFVTNTAGRVRKPYLCYVGTDEKEQNMVQVFLKGKAQQPDTMMAMLTIERDLGQLLSKITINPGTTGLNPADGATIEASYKKVTKPTISADVKLPNSGPWRIVSGDMQFSKSAADAPRLKEMGIAQEIKAARKDTKIKIYRNGQIQIYTKQGTNPGSMYTFTENQVDAAGSSVVLEIASDGTPAIMSKAA